MKASQTITAVAPFLSTRRLVRHIALASLIMVFGTSIATACVLCESLKKGKSQSERAKELDDKAADADASGDARIAAFARCRAQMLRANACHKIRSAKSKFGCALVEKKLALIWPDAPSEEECKARIDAFRGKPPRGGAGGLGGNGGGMGGMPGGPPGDDASGSVRAGGTCVDVEAGTTVTPVIWLAGNDADDLPSDFKITLTPDITDPDITLTSPLIFTETDLVDGEIRLSGTAPSSNTISVDIAPTATPGDLATWKFSIENLTTGELIHDSNSQTISVRVIGNTAPDVQNLIKFQPKGASVQKTMNNTAAVTFDWEFTNMGSSDVNFWIAVSPATDTLSRDTYFTSLVPHDILDYFTGAAMVGPAPQPTLTNPPSTALSQVIPVTAPGGGAGAGTTQSLSVSMVPGQFCEDGMTVCCLLRAFYQSGVDGSGDPIYELVSEILAPQYIFNQTEAESNNLQSSLVIVGEVAFPGGTLELDVNGTTVSTGLLPGEKGTDVAEAIALAINRHKGRVNGQFPHNALSARNKVLITGAAPGSVQIKNTEPIPGLIFSQEENVNNLRVSGIEAPFGDFGDVTANIIVETEANPVNTDISARLELNGAPFGEPVMLGANGQAASSSQNYLVSFPNVPLGRLRNEITVRVDPCGVVNEVSRNLSDNVSTELLELSLKSFGPITVDSGTWNLLGPSNFPIAVLFSESLNPGSFTLAANGFTGTSGIGTINLPDHTQNLKKGFFIATSARPQVPDETIAPDNNAFRIDHTLLPAEILQGVILDGLTLGAQVTIVNVIDANSGDPVSGNIISVPPGSIQIRPKFTMRPDPLDQVTGFAYDGALEVSYALQAGLVEPGNVFYVNVEIEVLQDGEPTGLTEVFPIVVNTSPR